MSELVCTLCFLGIVFGVCVIFWCRSKQIDACIMECNKYIESYCSDLLDYKASEQYVLGVRLAMMKKIPSYTELIFNPHIKTGEDIWEIIM